MKKTLKFAPDLVPLVLSGEKTSTWRINDEKNLTAGDTLVLLYQGTGEKFAEAEITHVSEKKLKDLTAEDKNGHETFSTPEEMYKKYSEYYKTQVTEDTVIKIIRLRISSSTS